MARRVSLAAVVMTALASAGCQSVGRFPGINPSDYAHLSYGCDFTQVYQFTVPQVETAALEAMADLGFRNLRREDKDGDVVIRAKTLDHRHVKVTIRPRNRMSAMTVRIGFGDEMVSDALIQRVALNFGTLPRTIIPMEPTLSRRNDPPPPPRAVFVVPAAPLAPAATLPPLPPALDEETPPPLPPAGLGPFLPAEEAAPEPGVPGSWT